MDLAYAFDFLRHACRGAYSPFAGHTLVNKHFGGERGGVEGIRARLSYISSDIKREQFLQEMRPATSLKIPKAPRNSAPASRQPSHSRLLTSSPTECRRPLPLFSPYSTLPGT